MFDDQTMEGEFQAMDEARAGWVRCNFAWCDLESVPGVWNLDGTDRVVDKAGEHGMKILGILGSSPSWANGDNPWNYPPTDMDAWRNYVQTVCARYQGGVSAWEVWNEEDIDVFWGSGPDPVAYTALLQATSEEIRAVDPGATIVMGGLAGGLRFEYLSGCLQAGAADYVDAIAYHPYPQTLGTGEYTPQEEKCRQIVQYMHQLISMYTTKDIQLWITEFGWTTCAQSPPGVDLDTQASYMLRSLINYAVTDLEMIFWYSLRDGLDTADEQNGLIKYDFTRKPSYHYYATFEDVFGQAFSVDPAAASFSCSRQDTLEAHCFRATAGGLALAAWKSDDLDDSLALTVTDPSFKSLYAVDPLTGDREVMPGVAQDAQGRLTVSGLLIGKEPLIIEASTAAPPEPKPSGKTFLFAEGYTGEGFEEWLCLANPNPSPTVAHVTYMFADGTTQEQEVPVGATTRQTVYVNDAVGKDKNVSVRVTSDNPIVAERPMYFNYRGAWTGGHDVVGYTP